jgi:putative nucleotidyltransferase with HDIG domain
VERVERDRAVIARLVVRMCSVLRDARRGSWLAPTVHAQLEGLREDLDGELRRGPLRLEFDDDEIRLRKACFDDLPRPARRLVAMVHRRGWRAIEFAAGVSTLELLVLLQSLQSPGERASDDAIARLEFVKPLERPAGGRSRPIGMPEVIRPSRLGRVVRDAEDGDGDVRSLVSDLVQAIDEVSGTSGCADTEPDGPGLIELVDDLGHDAVVGLILSSLRRHDAYTYDHSINVGLLSIRLAHHVGWRGRDLRELGSAALIHDVGKLYTPLEVLNKPSRLTPAEWITMKAHPREGDEILREAGVGHEIGPRIALEHHVRPDGWGYPPLPYGESGVHPGSRIVKIADAYDAFTTIRPYRRRTTPREALAMLREQAGTMFDPDLVEAFCEMMGRHPIGSVVRLASGRLALVVDVHASTPARPMVRVLLDADGSTPGTLTFVDLRRRLTPTGAFVDRIVETVEPAAGDLPIGRYV